MAFKVTLLEWGLQDFLFQFEEEGIDDESFPLIDDETVAKIFPKMGPRLIFKNKFKQFYDRENASNEGSSDIPSVLPEVLPISIDTVVDTGLTFKDFESCNPGPSGTIINITSPQSSSHSYELLDVLEDISSDISDVTEHSSISTGDEGPVKRMKLGSAFPDGLEGVLKKYTDGQIVLLNKQKLNNDCRQKLVKVLINELISSQGTEIKASTFFKIREEIETVFPAESGESYYIPYISSGKNKRGFGPKGKLWSRYTNVRAALRLANSQKVEAQLLTRSPERPQTSEETALINFLSAAVEPQDRILEAWEQTFKLRRRKYVNVELQQIYARFPCLKLNYGIQLIETDFNKRFPEKTDIIYSNWPEISKAILKEANERNIKYAEAADRGVQALLTLPFLFSPVTLRKNRKGLVWRPTRSEVQESFFLPVNTFDEIEGRLFKRKEKLKEYNISLQPLAAIVGCPGSPDGFYIIVDDIYYKVDSIIRTLELLFKLFHSLDVEYPIESEHIWIFIQELVFDIKSIKRIPSAESVVSDIKHHLNN